MWEVLSRAVLRHSSCPFLSPFGTPVMSTRGVFWCPVPLSGSVTFSSFFFVVTLGLSQLTYLQVHDSCPACSDQLWSPSSKLFISGIVLSNSRICLICVLIISAFRLLFLVRQNPLAFLWFFRFGFLWCLNMLKICDSFCIISPVMTSREQFLRWLFFPACGPFLVFLHACRFCLN